VSGLRQPVEVAAPASEPGRLYVVERRGRIRVLVNGKLRPRPFLDIRSLVESGDVEQGLLSVAFHPSYGSNHRFYVYYTGRGGGINVVEYRSDGQRALAGSARLLLQIAHPVYTNHNGGQLAFGPDGKLYLGTGDGGSEGDPEKHGQDLSSLVGKLLRIDVDRPDAQPEIVAYGLRNPWRFSFDPPTGDLYIGDVGQNRWEEIDFLPAGSRGLVNFGWRVWEGRARFKHEPVNPAGRLVFPIAVYGHTDGNCAVVGGFVYRGRQTPAARGRYFYGDFCSGKVWSLRIRNGKAFGLRREPVSIPGLSSFGQDARGELYLVSLQGGIYRLAGP
jgi:glucose/arabinose dehydrogenase